MSASKMVGLKHVKQHKQYKFEPESELFNFHSKAFFSNRPTKKEFMEASTCG